MKAEKQASAPAFRTRFAGLAESPVLEELWQHFPENMFLIRVERDGGFVVEAANPAQMATLGADVVGRRIHEFLPPGTAREVVARYRECLALNRPIRYEEGVTYYDANGNLCTGYWLTLLVPIHHHADRVTHLFGVSRNVTELRLTTQALERHNRELEIRVNERTAELQAANEELRSLNDRLHDMATRDFLTGTYNRRHLEELAEGILSQAVRHHYPLCLLMLDLDNFKRINDTQGHDAGDAVLRQVAETLRRELRSTDLVGRYGGDEFVVVLPDTRPEDAVRVADRLRRAVESTTTVTVSMGMARLEAGDARLGALTRRADRQLLDAKRQGRNRMVVGGGG